MQKEPEPDEHPSGGQAVSVRLATLGLACAVASACSGCDSPAAAPAVDPRTGLVVLDQIGAPDFTVNQPIHAVDAGWLVPSAGAALTKDGFEQADQVHFYRPDVSTATELAQSNGPVDVTSTAARFATGDGAVAAFSRLTGDLDARPGATPISTGPLGDAGHAITELATVQGVATVQITVVWRVGILVNSLVVYGRYGGARLDDVLVIAHAQTSNETGGGAPRPGRTAAASPTG